MPRHDHRRMQVKNFRGNLTDPYFDSPFVFFSVFLNDDIFYDTTNQTLEPGGFRRNQATVQTEFLLSFWVGGVFRFRVYTLLGTTFASSGVFLWSQPKIDHLCMGGSLGGFLYGIGINRGYWSFWSWQRTKNSRGGSKRPKMSTEI